MTIPAPNDDSVLAMDQAAEEVVADPGRAQRKGLIRRLLQNPVAVVCLIFLALLILAAVFAPLLTDQDPNRPSLDNALGPLTAEHPLGGDGVGRDVLARLLYGARITLLGASVAVAVAVLIGVPLGLISGSYRGVGSTGSPLGSRT